MIGRPFRFIAVTMATWTSARVAMLWPTIDSLPALVHAVIPPAAAATAFYAEVPPIPTRPSPPAAARFVRAGQAPSLPTAMMQADPAPSPAETVDEPLQAPPLRLPSLADPSRPARPGRLAASIWAVTRAGPGETRPGGQLGGSQAGIRVTYALGIGRRLALSTRLSAPLQGRSREAAVGLDWQPVDAPLHILLEQRFATGGGRGGPAMLVVGGVDPHPLGAGFMGEAYAQAGAVARDRIDGFADGAARITHPVARFAGLRLDLGIGSWAGVQRGAARVDIGPTAALAVPVAGHNIRVTLDWRQRIAGQARPGSGPALTIGGDF